MSAVCCERTRKRLQRIQVAAPNATDPETLKRMEPSGLVADSSSAGLVPVTQRPHQRGEAVKGRRHGQDQRR